MIQSVIKIGNSLGVTLPRDFVVRNRVKAGSKVAVTHSNGAIIYSSRIPRATKYEAITDGELAETVREVESRYGEELDDLARLE